MIETDLFAGIGLICGVVSLGLGVKQKNRKAMILGGCAILLWIGYVMLGILGVGKK